MSDYDSKIIRKQIRVYGSVQGVGFRYRTEHAAESVGATGWVRNDPDGSVFLGTMAQINGGIIYVFYDGNNGRQEGL